MTRQPVTITTELGLERRCPRCGEFWPAEDPEFWQPTVKRGRRTFHAYCRACLAERNIARRRSVLMAV